MTRAPARPAVTGWAMEASVPGPHAIKLHLSQQNKHASVPRSHEMGTPGGGGERGGEQHGDDGMARWGRIKHGHGAAGHDRRLDDHRPAHAHRRRHPGPSPPLDRPGSAIAFGTLARRCLRTGSAAER